jgi:hypothetical protein
MLVLLLCAASLPGLLSMLDVRYIDYPFGVRNFGRLKTLHSCTIVSDFSRCPAADVRARNFRYSKKKLSHAIELTSFPLKL